jgi:hypothetical protein
MFSVHKMTHAGTATVVSCQMHVGKLISGGLTNHSGWDWVPFDLILDVFPEGAPPFRTEVRKHFGSIHSPESGDKLRVRCNPEKHAVKIDVSEDVRFNRKLRLAADKSQRKEEHDRLLHAPPGTPAEGDDPELAEFSRLEQEDNRDHAGG